MQDIENSKKIVRILLPYLAILATLYTLYLAKTILLPIVVAAFIALFSNPLVSRLECCRISRSVGSVLVLVTIILAVSSIALLFTNPAQQWWQKLPEIANTMSDSLGEATESLKGEEKDYVLSSISREEDASNTGEEIRNTTFLAVFKSFASATPVILTQILATIFLVYFFLVYGQLLLLRIIQARSSFEDKRITVELVNTMQGELSSYISTITLVNIGLGLTVGIVFYFFGVKDPFLWGALAGVLNFAPYIGPMVSAVAFALVSYLQFGDLKFVVLIPSVYLGINLIESQFLTPTLLGRTLDLNPLVVFVWLLLWGWLWGGFGMLVGLPLLVCLSIYLERTGIIGNWHILLKHRNQNNNT